MTELNPHHPVTKELHDAWHKICALLMRRLMTQEVIITSREVEEFTASSYTYIVAHSKHDGIHIHLVDREEAEEILRRSTQRPFLKL